MNKKTCLVIVGPTAVGKSSLAIQLAKQFNSDIISADSRQCFRELNIGVAKPTAAQLNAVKHYFINSHSIKEEVNAAVFERYALEISDKIFANKDIAIMVGGTGLYIKAFCEGMDEIPEVPLETHNAIVLNYEKYGLSWLQQEIRQKDPEYFLSGENQNPQRLMRALEVKSATGFSIRSFQKKISRQRPFNTIKIGLELPREELYANINYRVNQMIQDGLIEEVKSLAAYAELNALQTVGYSEIFEYLNGNYDLQVAINNVKKNTRHYAKRQMTWFKKDDAINWFSPQDLSGIISFIRQEYNVE